MDRETHDADHPTLLHHSSIALLQERFRQLQRVKEMREERQLLRMLTLTEPNKQFFMITNNWKPTTATTCQCHPPASSFFHPELMIIPSPSPHDHPHVSLSLWPTSSQDVDHRRNAEAQPPDVSLTLRPSTHSLQDYFSWKKNVCHCDSDSDSAVDTSLHL